MDQTAFAAGPALVGASPTYSAPAFCAVALRRPNNAVQTGAAVLRNSSFVTSFNDARIFPCGCVDHRSGRCSYIAGQRVTPRMGVTLTVGEAAIADLMKENAAFVRGEAKVFPGVPEERERLVVEGQAPKVAVIACADSRVAPEILFRANIGELFVIRAAGNTAWGDEALGSLEFAINVLKVSAVLVLGHTKCGAVAAALSGGEIPGALGNHVTNISKALAATGGVQSDVDAAVEVNVRVALDFLRKDPDGAVPQGEKVGLVVRGGVYDIASGRVRLIDA